MSLKAVAPSLMTQRGVSELSILVHVNFDVRDFGLELKVRHRGSLVSKALYDDLILLLRGCWAVLGLRLYHVGVHSGRPTSPTILRLLIQRVLRAHRDQSLALGLGTDLPHQI